MHSGIPMNQISPAFRGLYWKEACQLIPRVATLVGLSVLLVVVWSALDVTSQFGSIIGDYIPLTMPALYAAGVGAILVGQETENRAPLWCSSLPIASSHIATVKYACVAMPFVATWVMMRRFMENNVRWPMWATGVCVAGLFFALPTIPISNGSVFCLS
jgi:hypothetical protein